MNPKIEGKRKTLIYVPNALATVGFDYSLAT